MYHLYPLLKSLANAFYGSIPPPQFFLKEALPEATKVETKRRRRTGLATSENIPHESVTYVAVKHECGYLNIEGSYMVNDIYLAFRSHS